MYNGLLFKRVHLWFYKVAFSRPIHAAIAHGNAIFNPRGGSSRKSASLLELHLFLCPPVWQKRDSYVWSCFKEDMLTVVRKGRLCTRGGPPQHLMRAPKEKCFLLFFFFSSKNDLSEWPKEPEATPFHLLSVPAENVISPLVSIFSVSKHPGTYFWDQPMDSSNKLGFGARVLFIVIQSLKKLHHFGDFH